MNIKHTLNAVLVITGLALGSMLTACIHDSNASGASNPVKLLAVSSGKAGASAQSQFTEAQVRAFDFGGAGRARPQQESAVSAGTVLGTVMNTDPANTPIITICTTGGVCFLANANSGDVQQLSDVYYTNADCSGDAFATVGDSQGNSISTLMFRNGGQGFVEQDGVTVGMVLKSDQPVNAHALSDLHNGSCNTIDLQGSFFFTINPNVAATSQLAGGNVGQISFTN